MKDLSKKVIKAFLWSLFLIYAENGIIDELFDYFFNQMPPRNTQSFWALTLIYFAFKIFVFVQICFSFIKKVQGDFQVEIKRQLDEQHLVYASITHDLKTPLTSVKGYSKALLDGRVKAEDQEKTFQTIYRKTDEMNVLLTDLLEYAKLSNETYQPEKVQTDVSELLKTTLINHYDAIEQKDFHLKVSIEEGITAKVAPNEMRRVFDNLIHNAIVHNDPTTYMEVGFKKRPNGWTFFVADSGEKIPPEDQDRLFDPFAKLDPARTTSGGSGLGLAIVKKIVAYHKGQVSISEEVPGYTKAFVVEVPR